LAEGQNIAPNELTLEDVLTILRGTTEFKTRLTNVNDLLGSSITPLFENIEGDPYSNVELGDILLSLANSINVNTKEILFLKHLIAQLTFEIVDQGVKINNKDLIENLNIYLKYNYGN
jgi:hypothetical protein